MKVGLTKRCLKVKTAFEGYSCLLYVVLRLVSFNVKFDKSVD